MNGIGIGIGLMLLLIGVGIGIGTFVAGIPVQIEYKNNVRGYMDRAYWSMSPDEMMDNFRMAKQGMENLSLKPEMYGNYIFETMDMRMDAQYKKMDALIQRAEGARGYCNGTIVVAQIGQGGIDMCETKLNSLKTFINDANGWGDDIAEAVYYVNYHPFIGLWNELFAGAAIVIGIILMWVGANA